MQKLSVISKKSSFPILLRKFVQTHTMRFRTAVIRAIAHRKNECTSTTQKIEGKWLYILPIYFKIYVFNKIIILFI